jgi:hypothetical protein
MAVGYWVIVSAVWAMWGSSSAGNVMVMVTTLLSVCRRIASWVVWES